MTTRKGTGPLRTSNGRDSSIDDGASFLGLQRPRGREPMRDPDSYGLSIHFPCGGTGLGETVNLSKAGEYFFARN